MVSPVRVRVSPLGPAEFIREAVNPPAMRVAINGYSIGFLGPVYFELETESPVLVRVRGLFETK